MFRSIFTTAAFAAALALAIGCNQPENHGHTGGIDHDAPLFINLISDESHRAKMALTFGKRQLTEQGHPLTVFLNDRGVIVATKSGADRFAEHHKLIAEILEAGGELIICRMCMQQYGVAESDLIDGIDFGGPERTGEALFRKNSRALTW